MLDSDFQDETIRSRLDGTSKMMVITDHFVIYVDTRGIQGLPLADVTKVISEKTGSLKIESATSGTIQCNMRGFEITKLQTFFNDLKSNIARAKQVSLEPGASFPLFPKNAKEYLPLPTRPGDTTLSAASGVAIVVGAVSLVVLLLLLPVGQRTGQTAAVFSAFIALVTYFLMLRRTK